MASKRKKRHSKRWARASIEVSLQDMTRAYSLLGGRP